MLATIAVVSSPARLRSVLSLAGLFLLSSVTAGSAAAQMSTPPDHSSVTWTAGLPEPARVRAGRKRRVDLVAREGRIKAAAASIGLHGLSVDSGGGNGPSSLYGSGRSGNVPGPSPLAAADRFLRAFAPVYGLSNADLNNVQKEERAGFLPAHREVIVRQTIAGRPLFGGQLRLHLGPAGEFVAAIGELYGNLRWAGDPALTADMALARARSAVDHLVKSADTDAPSPGAPLDSARATEVAYPISDVATPAFLITGVVAANGIDMFDVVVDGISGEVLEVIARTFHVQGQVFQNGAAVPQSPQPSVTPGVAPPTPNPPSYVSRVTIPFPNLLTATVLSGNNANIREFQAWNREELTATAGNPITSATSDFSFPLNIGLGQPDIRNYATATGTNLFYLINYAHDYFYALGFDEAHGNFQVANGVNGGLGNDPVVAFTQLGSRASGQAFRSFNAFMSTPSDGSSPVMGMFVWVQSGSAPNIIYTTDSALDPDITMHEFTHGVTTRLIPGSFPYTRQPGAINEGNSDFFALLMQVPQSAAVDGAYPLGTYSTQDFGAGIRFYPYSSSLLVNPLTYASLGHVASRPEVHADGEIWAVTLWQMRSALINSLGFTTGTARAAQLDIDALQLLPNDPTFVDFRNAIFAADQARYGGADINTLWAAFATRGLGALAAGGVNGYSMHILSDTSLPSTAARVRLFDSQLYVGEPVRVLVSDSNAASSSVTVTTSSGDSETLPLSAAGPAFAGSLASLLGSPVSGDGNLQVQPGDTITVATTDSSTGGATPTLSATATAHAPYNVSIAGSSSYDPNAAITLLFRGDETSQEVTLPFSFSFYGQTYSKVHVSDNGHLSFDFAQRIRERGLGRSGVPPLIAPFSSDLDCRMTSGGVFVYAGLDRFTVRWACNEYSVVANLVNVTATLFPNGTIRFDYGPGNILSGLDYYTNLADVATVGLVRGTDTFWQPAGAYDQSTNLGNAGSVLFTPMPDCIVSGVAITGPATGGCDGTTQTLDAGAGYATYAWSKNATPISGGTTRTLTVTMGGTYDVVVTDVNGCVGSASHVISYTAAPHAVITGANLYCPVALDAGAGFATYAWKKDAAPAVLATSQMFTATSAGSYTVTVSNGTCSGTSSPFVVLSTAPVVFGPSSVCPAAPITLETSIGYDTYQWMSGGTAIAGATGRSISVSAAATYTVQVTRAGCIVTSAPKPVSSNCGPVPVVYNVHVDDRPAGNGDRLIESAETVRFSVAVANSGLSSLTGITGTLSSSIAGVTIAQAASPFADIAPGRVGLNTQAYSVTASCSTPLGLTLTLVTLQGTFVLPLNVSARLPGQDWRAAGPLGVDPGEFLNFSFYDPVRAKLAALSNIGKWEWDGTFWSRSATNGEAGSSSVFDPIRGRLVTIRVSNGTPQTWEFDPVTNTWAQRSDVSGTPAVGYGSAAAFDARRGVAVVFGGQDFATGAYSNGTWEFDGKSWRTVVTPLSPPPRSDFAMAFDPARGVIVMAGGYNPNMTPNFLSDSWQFDGTSWTAGPYLPDGINQPSLAYSPAHGGLVLAGGYGWNTTFTSTLLYSGSTWVNLGQAVPRVVSLSLAFDDRRRRLTALTSSGNVFENDGAGWVIRADDTAEASNAPTVAYDPIRKTTVVLPNRDGQTPPSGTAQWDGTSWKFTTGTQPLPSKIVFATFLNKTVAVDSGGATWTYDGATWIRSPTATKPLPPGAVNLFEFALASDSARGRIVLFGGYYYPQSTGTLTYSNETWEFDGTNWTKAAPATSPAPRHAPMAFDAARGVMVLYGGYAYNNTTFVTTGFTDLWEWNGVNWVQRAFASPAPVTSYTHQAVYYPTGGGVLFWGSSLGPNGWIWTGTSWLARSAGSVPPYSISMGLAYDSSRDVLVATNGASTFEFGSAASCSINPHGDVTVSTAAGQCGAVVNYTPPTFTGVCGLLSSSPAAGSFFSAGITTVTITSTCGKANTFRVTVTPAGGSGCSPVFTDDPLVAGQTRVKSVHITELRSYVNTLRTQAGLAQFNFTDPTLAGVIIRTVHITELRTALDAARSALGRPPVSYARALGPGMLIMANDITELRNGVK